MIAETEQRVRASEADLDPMRNSNCKWFETAYQTVQAVEQMIETIDEQENQLTSSQIAKKDKIIEQADAQNEAYQREIEELDRLIAEKM